MENERKMKAAVMHKYGNPDVLKYEEVEIPAVQPDEVLVKVHYSSINPMDWKVRAGYTKDSIPLKLPAVIGIDVAGTVEKVGAAVKNFKEGDKVFGRADFTKGGSYAEFTSVKEASIAHAPKRITLREAAGLPVVAGTAWGALFDHAKLKSGQRILITGASGGVGTLAVQLAKNAGAYVIGTTSTENLGMVKGLGADEAIDYTKEDFSKKVKDVDVVFDTVGGDTLTKAYSTLKRGGILVTIAGQPDNELARKYGITVKGGSIHADGKRFTEIAKVVDSGKLKVVIDKEYPLKDIREAHAYSESRKAKGKIILKVTSSND